MKKLVKSVLGILLVFLVSISIVFLLWGMNPAKASENTKVYLKNSKDVRVFLSENRDLLFEPVNQVPIAGIVFYPGGHVDYTAYAPLAYLIAEKGIRVIVLKVPLSLAFFRINGAKEYVKENTYIKWFVSGHSLGGVAACEFARKNPSLVQGIILLASYPSRSMTNFDGAVLSLLGSNDGLVIQKKWEEKKILLPKHTEYFVINGGNHSQFGEYGLQRRDKPAEISSMQQKKVTANIIADFILKNVKATNVSQ